MNVINVRECLKYLAEYIGTDGTNDMARRTAGYAVETIARETGTEGMLNAYLVERMCTKGMRTIRR